jgi:hypothetical protein
LAIKDLNLEIIVCGAQKGRIENTEQKNTREDLTFWRIGEDRSVHWKQREKSTHNLQSTEGEIGQGAKRQ